MAIDWETGDIDHQQHILEAEQLTPMIRDMEYFQAAYIDASALSADEQGGLWLNPDAITYTKEDATIYKNNDFLCRLIRLEEGYIVDASAGDYQLSETSGDTVDVETDFDLDEAGWISVVGLIGTDLQREEFEKLLFERDNIALDPSVLLATVSVEADEAGEPEDGSVS